MADDDPVLRPLNDARDEIARGWTNGLRLMLHDRNDHEARELLGLLSAEARGLKPVVRKRDDA
jgi:hypothetical protein